jgi:predicted dehydrogenase
MEPIRLGIIGTGLAAKGLHWPALRKLSAKFKIPVVCNHTEAKAKEFASLAGGVPYVLDYPAVLQNPAVEAVDIILPIHLNYPVVKECLAAGKHVLVEKPLAASLAEGRELVSLASAHPDLVTMVAENYRYERVVREGKRILESGAIGRPYAVFAHSFSHMDFDNKYAHTQWRLDHQYPGGFILDGGVHYAAILNSWFGNVVPRSGFTRSINPAIGKVDTFSMQFSAGDGIQGVMNWFSSTPGFAERRFIVMGDQGTILLEGPKITVKRKGEPDQVFDCQDDGGFVAEFEDFYGAVREGKKTQSSFADGYLDMEVIIKGLEVAGEA